MRDPIVGLAAHKYAEDFLGQLYWLEADQEKLDRSLLRLAEKVGTMSKDPSTKTGAVLFDGRVFAVGYNGFAQHVDDDPARYADRDTKLEMVIHAEVNAVILAAREGHGLSLAACNLYTWPFMPCSRCAALMIQAGVRRVVAPVIDPGRAARWGDSLKLARAQFSEAGVELLELP